MADRNLLILTDDAIEKTAARWLSQARGMQDRLIVGVAGIPGAGKSTLAARLVEAMDRQVPDTAALIPMDGFHLPHATLEARGQVSRKGAEFTFDVEGYVELLRRYRHAETVGTFPVYSRQIENPMPANTGITLQTRVIVTEGLYLLLPQPPWSALAEVIDECWWLELPADTARKRLRQRDADLGRSVAVSETRYERNDRINTETILVAQRTPDRIVSWTD